MSQKNIELELRAEVKNTDRLLSKLESGHKLVSHTERLSAMFFGETDAGKFDLRVRITNGESEVVIKKGGFHVDDRIEIPQSITSSQFMGFVRQFDLFDFDAEIAERETYNFDLGDGIILSVVKAGDIAYVEIEKITDEYNVDDDRSLLYEVANEFDLEVIEEKQVFDELCDRLSENCDWTFEGTENDFDKLESQLANYTE